MLTPRQLAAARALVRGMGAEAVAQRFGTTRQTINRWRRLPIFARELRRLHEMLMQPPLMQPPLMQPPPPASMASPTRAPRLSTRPMTKREADEVESLIARVLGGKP